MNKRSKLLKQLKIRDKELQGSNVKKKVAKYVINSFKRGKAINRDRIAPHQLDLFLIELETTKHAIRSVIERLDDIEDGQEWLFIVGDYGSGKTQLKNRIQTKVESRRHGFLVILSVNLQEDSLEGFCKSFVQKLKELIRKEHKESYSYFQPLFKEFSEKNHSTKNKVRIVIKLVKVGVTQGLKFLIQFDEIDQIPDEETFQSEWAGLFVMINDQVDEGVLVLVYIAEREINRLWNKDTRLHRFQVFLTERLDPGSKFDSKYIEGIANVLSIYQKAENFKYDQSSLELMEAFLEFHKRRLQGFSLREFNIAAYLLCHKLHIFQKNAIWKIIEDIKRKDRTLIGQKAEHALIQLVQGLQLFFNVEGEQYIAEILAERIIKTVWKSDGSIRITKEVDGEFVIYLNLPIEVKYTTGSFHESSQLKKVEKMVETEPTVFFSIGIEERNREKLQNRFQKFLIEKRMVIINIDELLFDPIFANTKNASPSLRANLREWFIITSRLKQLLQPFFEDLVKDEFRKELMELRAEIERIKAVSASVPSTKGSQHYFDVTTSIVALFNKTSSGRKRKSSLPKHVLNQLHSPISNFDEIYNKIIEGLLKRGFLHDSGASYKTTKLWEKEKLDDFCREMKKGL